MLSCQQQIINLAFTKFFVAISGSSYSSAKTTQTREISAKSLLDIRKDVARESNIKEEMRKI